MSSERSRTEQPPEVVVSDLRPEQLLLVLEAVAKAARGSDGQAITIASREDAERLIDRVLQSLCRTYPARCPEGLYRHVVRIVDRSVLSAVLGRVDGCQVRAAEILGISRNTLRSKMRELGLEREDFGAGPRSW